MKPPGYKTGYKVGHWIAMNMIPERFVMWYGKRKGLL